MARTSGRRPSHPPSSSRLTTTSARARAPSPEISRATVSAVGGRNPSERASHIALRASATSSGLNRVGMLAGPDVDRLVDGRAEQFLAVPAIGNDRVVVERDLPPAKRALVRLRALGDRVAEDHAVRAA